MVPFCNKCDADGKCIRCNTRFILTNNTCICQSGFTPQPADSPLAECVCSSNSCLQCQVQNCISCQSDFTCDSCALPYVLVEGICVECEI